MATAEAPPPPPAEEPPPPPDVASNESVSGSEAPSTEAPPADDTKSRGSQEVRASTLQQRGSQDVRASQRGSQEIRASQRGSQQVRPSLLERRGSQAKRASQQRGSRTDGKPPRRQWDSQRASSGIEQVDLETPETMELLRRLKEAEELESSSSSSGHAGPGKAASPRPGDHHRAIKALHRAVQENDMPMRLAYAQLDELAANADRVKLTIEQNRSLLTRQVKKTNDRVMRVAFMSWSLEVEYQKHKKLQLKRALSWYIRTLEQRAFHGWSRAQKLGKKNRRFEASVKSMLQRRKLGRIWRAWRDFIAERRRKHEDERKEKKIRKSIDEQFRFDLAKRAVKVLRRANLRRYWRFFQEGIEAKLQAKAFLKQMLILLLKKSAFRAFMALREAARRRKDDREFIKARRRKALLKKCFHAWWLLIPRNALLRLNPNDICLLHSKFLWWRTLLRQEKYNRRRYIGIFKKLDRGIVHRCFLAFADVVWTRKCVRGLIKRQLEKSGRRLLHHCFKNWISFMQMEALNRCNRSLKENQKLRSDNERLSTMVDKGSDLKAAQDVLSAERVVLTKLIGRLQRQHQSALDQQGRFENEIKQLKSQLANEVTNGEKTTSLLNKLPKLTNVFERNKLLVKGASSFNTLMKVMKHDLTKKGMKRLPPASPELVYEVDNMAMDQVSVFPDGELHVKAFTPRKKGLWSPTRSTADLSRKRAVPTGPKQGYRTHGRKASDVKQFLFHDQYHDR